MHQKNKFKQSIDKLLEEFKTNYNDLEKIKLTCVSKVLGIRKKGVNYYSNMLKRYIKFITFDSKSKPTKEAFLNVAKKLGVDKKMLLVTNKKTGNIDLKKLFKEYKDVDVKDEYEFISDTNSLV